MRKIYLLAIMPLLAACGTQQTPIQITAPPVVQTYHPPLPAKVVMRDVKWEVLTRQQLIELVEQHQESQVPLVLYSLRETGFENLAMNIQELKRYILESRALIDYYKRVLPQMEEPPEGEQRERAFSAPQRALTSEPYIEETPLYEFGTN